MTPATERWKAMVETEHAQSDGMRATAPPADHWRPYARQFEADPRRSGDELVDRLASQLDPSKTLIDVGAGGGRMALPLALRCRHVTAVEPSQSMADVLLQQTKEHGIDNVSLVQARWEEAQVAPADIVLCAHVIYTVTKIDQFVRKLEAHGRELVIIVLYDAAPQSQTYPIWKHVHGVERLALPSLSELEEVLTELGISPEVDRLTPQPPRGFDSLEQAAAQLSSRLYLGEGSLQSKHLEEVLREELVEIDGVFVIRGAKPLTPTLVSWQPSNNAGS
ncbi:MAG: hypothetical protein BZY88_04340 [SAR202 cluster bacterium Io17-Chloro-G9]|nr:MAG: hypothetical protein BZY88_04340 [SAR202 cluster bacterium Io17-Chloro-G9]